jgi:tetratricopeptide (TPR) repeat protein
VRDVVYQAIPREVRARDHERYGRELADRAGGRLAEMQEIVGYHLETAFGLRRGLSVDAQERSALGHLAAAHLAAAGRRAFGRDDEAAAASLFGRAFACETPEDPQRGELARLRGAALFDLGRFAEAEEALRDGIEAVSRGGDEAVRWRLEVERTHTETYLRPGEVSAAAARAFAESAVAALTELGDIAGLARANRLLGETLLLQGRLEEANEAFLRGWELAEEAGDEREIALLPQLSGLHGPTPLPVFIRQCERLLAETPRPRPETLMRLGFAQALVGLGDEARHRMDEGLAYARDVGGAFRVADAEMHAGAAMLYLDDPRPAADHLERAVEGLEAIGERGVLSTAVALLGEAWLRLGRLDDAESAAEQSRTTAADDDQASQMAWRQVRAKALAVRGELPAARGLIAEAVEIADGTDFLTMAAFAHLDASEIADLAGDADDARRQRSRALELLDRKGASERIAERTTTIPVTR